MKLNLTLISICFNLENGLHLYPVIETLNKQKHVELSMIMFSYAISNPKTMVIISLNASLALTAMFCSVFAYMLADGAKMTRRFVR